MLYTAGQFIDDSPSSGDLFELDSLFAQETLERAGLKLGEGDELPLYVVSQIVSVCAAEADVPRFLDGQSLGGLIAPTEMTPYVGIEHFFLPAEVDHRLGGPSDGGFHGGHGGPEHDPLGGDVWW